MHLLDSADGELSTSELAHQLGLPAGTTSRVVDALVQAGIVDRREGDGDRRVKSLQLTEAGLDAVRPVWPARRDSLAQLVSGLTPAQRDTLSAARVPMLDGLALVGLFALRGLRARRPLIDLRPFRRGAMGASAVVTLFIAIGFFGTMITLPSATSWSVVKRPGHRLAHRPPRARRRSRHAGRGPLLGSHWARQDRPDRNNPVPGRADPPLPSRPFCTGYRSDGSEGVMPR
jgi:DNA-binding MarR family transcriptional regulator